MKESTVLWISRHTMTQPQLADLERIMGGDVHLLAWADTINNMADIQPLVERADAVCAVLPLEKLIQLIRIAGEKPVLVATSKRIPTGRIIQLPDGRTEQEFDFVHQGWQQILDIQVRVKQL